MTEESVQCCPNCKLTNPPDALKCDCGYDFATGKIPESALRAKRAPYLRVLKRALLLVWFIAGPILCYALANLVFPGEAFMGYSDPGRLSRYVIGSAIAGMPMFLLAIPIWLRLIVFVIYVAFVIYALPIVLVLIACYGFGNCP